MTWQRGNAERERAEVAAVEEARFRFHSECPICGAYLLRPAKHMAWHEATEARKASE